MRVSVHLFGQLNPAHPEDGIRAGMSLMLEPGARAADIIEFLKVPPAKPIMIFINNRHAEAETELAEGDRVSLFPVVAGG